MKSFFLPLSTLAFVARISAFPAYASLAGLSQRELDDIVPTLKGCQLPPPPGPLKDSSAKLVNDAAHPWMPLKPGDIRGPCPGLNALASHGWLPRNGIASPSEIVTAVQEADFFFGNNHDTVFDQFVDYSNRFGAGKYNLTVAAELRYQRIQESIATNPNFSLISPRFFTAYAESTFPYNFFVDGRKDDAQLDMDAARSFFQEHCFPDDFHRTKDPRGAKGIIEVFRAHPVKAGGNVGKVNSYTPDPNSADFSNLCRLYENFLNQTIKGLYPAPKGPLRRTLNKYLDYLHLGVGFLGQNCTQIFPYGKD